MVSDNRKTDSIKQAEAREYQRTERTGLYEHGYSEFTRYATLAGTRELNW